MAFSWKRTNQKKVGVGIMVAHDPLHGSGRADFPHPALTSGNDAHAAQRERMIDPRRRQPVVDQTLHSFSPKMAPLASAQKRPVPELTYPIAEQIQRCGVHGHSVVTDVPTHNRTQPLAYIRDGSVHTQFQQVNNQVFSTYGFSTLPATRSRHSPGRKACGRLDGHPTAASSPG